ncbi:hypothetical protein I79_025816 [Cricetulus griseus]|uniref:Uncharacterized protein n=1 Tax=Cricetulus griseus TaxID=10029 RepID=G3IPB0_CRIGR|nr:hypothetical protein I79_025816 [Cricetulus griseus]
MQEQPDYPWGEADVKAADLHREGPPGAFAHMPLHMGLLSSGKNSETYTGRCTLPGSESVSTCHLTAQNPNTFIYGMETIPLCKRFALLLHVLLEIHQITDF